MSAALLMEVDVVSPAGAASTLRFADRAVRPFPPTDADRANLIWADRIVESPSLKRSLFDDLATLSPGLGFGLATLSNADRGLDTYQSYAWNEFRVWLWPGGAFSASTMVLKGLVGQPGFGLSSGSAGKLTLPIYDYRAELDQPLQTTVFTGGNGVGGVLYEGTADGLKGRAKPLAYGRLEDAHLPAPQVNAGTRTHQLHAGVMEGHEQIFDRGYPGGQTDNGDYSGSAFDSATLPAASYATDVGRGLLRINDTPTGTVTFGVRGDASGTYVETAGPILARLLAKAGVPAGRIGASVAALSGSAVVGVWTDDSTAAREVVGWLARSVPAAVAPGRDGVWAATAVLPPAAVATAAIAADEVIAIESDDTTPGPAGEVSVGWGRIWQTFKPGDLAPALRGTASEERLGTEYRYATVVDAAAKAAFPRSWRRIEITTALRVEADAVALAGALKTLFGLRSDGRPRRMWKVTLELTTDRLSTALGSTVSLVYPAAGINDRFVLLGEELMRPSRDRVIWSLWG